MELARSQSIPIYGLNFMDERDKALAMLGQLGDPYVATGFDADGKVGIDFGAYGAPETFLVDAAGTILHKHPYTLTRDVWEREFLPRIEVATKNRALGRGPE